GQVGDDAVIDVARRLGVTSPLAESDPSLALGTSTMTLLELTSAYAGDAANQFPVAPRAFPAEEEGWFDWLFADRHRFSAREHEAIQQMLRRAVNQGTGRAAMLSVPNFGETGTSQDNRDALFVGYAGDLVVGVWIGNDDNTPLAGVHGGGLPARIWKDFMSQALGERAPARAVRPTPSPDPSGPVQPLDVPDLQAIPLGGSGATLNVGNGGAVISGEIEGVPVGVRLDREGLRIEAQPRGRERAPAEAAPAATPAPAPVP